MQCFTRNIPHACFVIGEEENITLSTIQMMPLCGAPQVAEVH